MSLLSVQPTPSVSFSHSNILQNGYKILRVLENFALSSDGKYVVTGQAGPLQRLMVGLDFFFLTKLIIRSTTNTIILHLLC